jgi:hypothetical protein
MDDTPNHPGLLVRAWRLRQDPIVTLRDLAARFDKMSAGNLSRIETGHQPITDDLLPEFVALTGIPARELRPDLAHLFEEAAE